MGRPPVETVTADKNRLLLTMAGLHSFKDSGLEKEAEVSGVMLGKNAAGFQVGFVKDGEDAPVDCMTLNVAFSGERCMRVTSDGTPSRGDRDSR
ncbi:hypothetical protein AHAS_Ahas01G0132200 [Arachis hypogaea]